MRVVALISGGKDSIYNAILTQAEGHEVISIVNLRFDTSYENFHIWSD